RVDGLPGVLTCMTALRGGEVVRRERGWPSADRDVLGVVDRLGSLAPIGVQYRRVRRWPSLAHAFEGVLAQLAAPGERAEETAAQAAMGSGRTVEVDVAVIGGGRSGLRAAAAAAEAGSTVCLIERRAALGGRHADESLAATVRGLTPVTVLTDAAAFGWY